MSHSGLVLYIYACEQMGTASGKREREKAFEKAR